MFCSNCGTQLPDDANFCLKCGQPQKQSQRESTATKQFDVCTIMLHIGLIKLRWEAWQDKKKLAQSDEFSELSLDIVSRRRQKNMDLVSKFLVDGWEVIATDQEGCVTAMRKLKKQ